MQSQIADNIPSYIPERWHLTLIMWALLISVGLMNMYIFWLIPWLELTAGIMHVILFIIFVVVLVTLAPRHDSHFVWFSETIQSGWDRSSAVAFNLGMLVPAWGFIGRHLPIPAGSQPLMMWQGLMESSTCLKKFDGQSMPSHGL